MQEFRLKWIYKVPELGTINNTFTGTKENQLKVVHFTVIIIFVVLKDKKNITSAKSHDLVLSLGLPLNY